MIFSLLIRILCFFFIILAESDLLTFAQRKQHYDCDKSYRKELFTADSRPRSVRVLYEDAGKVTPPPPPTTSTHTAQSSAAGSPQHPYASGQILGEDGMMVVVDSSTGVTNYHHHMAAGSDDLLCTSVFGENTNSKMHKRIDAEIEIRLVSTLPYILMLLL